MRLFYIISLGIILKLCIGQQFQCPLNDDLVPINGTFPDPNICFIYYHCINGVAHPQQCPPGLYFTLQLKNCKYQLCVQPEQAECSPQFFNKNLHFKHLRKISKRQISSLKNNINNKNFECDPNIDGTFPNPSDCRQYYHCVNGVSWPQQCPGDYAFNPVLNIRDCNVQVCIPREQARCPVDGGWSEWSAFGDCLPNCGNGVKARFRECNNPPPSNGGALCPGSNIELEECKLEDCLSNHPAFFISNRRNTRPFFNRRHRFDKVIINNNNIYNTTLEVVKVKETGYYWFSFIVTSLSYRGSESDRRVSAEFWRSAGANAYVTDEMNAIHLRDPTQSLARNIVTRSTGVLGSEDGAETAWLGYKIKSPFVYYAQRSLLANAENSAIIFNFIRLAEGLTGNGLVTAPKTGYYYISFSYRYTEFCSVEMRVNGVPLNAMTTTIATDVTRNTQDMKSKSIVAHLNERDNFGFFVTRGRIQSDGDRQITLSAYYLNETSEFATVIRVDDFSTFNFTKLKFDYALHNVGSSYSFIRNEFKCKNGGLYKVSISLGVAISRQLIGEILVNGEVQGRLYSLPTNVRRDRFISRTSLLNLQPDDIISVQVKGSLDASVTHSVLNIIHLP